MKKMETQNSWSKTGRSIFEKFAVGLQEFFQTGVYPTYGDQDVKYCLELQKNRLDKKGLRMEYQMTPRGHFAYGGGPGRSWSDERYTSSMECRTCKISKVFYRNGKRVYNKIKNYIFYQIITNAHNMDVVSNDLYTCPNCAAVSKVETLRQGCPYCGTHFKISELFPKVTGFYFVEDVGGTEREIKGSIFKTIFPCILISIIGFTFSFLVGQETDGHFLVSVIKGIFSGILFGTIAGYMFWAFGKLAYVFAGAAKSVPMLFDTVGSRRHFEQKMKEYSPEFSYEYFSSKVVSYLKILIYSENIQNLPIYKGVPIGELTKDIVEVSYTGATALRNFKIKGNTCQANVAVYLENLYYFEGKIKRKSEVFLMTLEKNVGKPIDYFFSIKKIYCKNCGDSFDATKQRKCPSCGSLYEIEDEEWIVVDIRKS